MEVIASVFKVLPVGGKGVSLVGMHVPAGAGQGAMRRALPLFRLNRKVLLLDPPVVWREGCLL